MTYPHYNYRELFDKDTDLEIRLRGTQRPAEGEIIDFLDDIHWFANTTRVPKDFSQTLSLLRKWKVILLTFYDKNYMKSISRTASSWKEEHPFISSHEQKMLNEVEQEVGSAFGLWGTGSQLEEVSMQSDYIEDTAPDPNFKHEDDDQLSNSLFFVRQST